MALTTEQQAQIDIANAMDDHRTANISAETAKQRKLEMLRMAKDILVENRRTQAAADATDITASAVTALATELNTFVTN